MGFATWVGAPCLGARVKLARFALFAACWATFVFVASPAVTAAQVHPTVVTTVDPCVPVDLAHFRRLLSIELGTSIEYQAEAPRGPGRTWVHVGCAREGIVLNLDDGVTGKSMARLLNVSEIQPADSTRLLALAVAEFVVASWVELRAVPRPALPALGALPPSAANPAVERAVQRSLATESESPDTPFTIGVGLGIDAFTSHAALLPTASLRIGVVLPPVAFVLGGDIGFVGVPVEREDMRVATINVTRATGLSALMFGGVLDAFSLWLGPGVRFGVMRLRSESKISMLQANDVLSAHGGVVALGRASYRAAQHLSLDFELEAGAITLPVRTAVGDVELLQFSGAWVSAGLRAAVLF